MLKPTLEEQLNNEPLELELGLQLGEFALGGILQEHAVHFGEPLHERLHARLVGGCIIGPQAVGA